MLHTAITVGNIESMSVPRLKNYFLRYTPAGMIFSSRKNFASFQRRSLETPPKGSLSRGSEKLLSPQAKHNLPSSPLKKALEVIFSTDSFVKYSAFGRDGHSVSQT